MSVLQNKSSILFDLALDIGRGQAFGFVANGCLAAQAQCLKKIRDTEAYKEQNLTWDDFCDRYAGVGRRQADRLIQQLEEFGETYFRLAEIMKISPQAYRQLSNSGVIKDDALEVDGELVPITPENGPRIKAAVMTLRRDLDLARQRPVKPVYPSLSYLNYTFMGYYDMLEDILEHRSNKEQYAELEEQIVFSIHKLEQLRDRLEDVRE